ncbi:MAG: hypothetical protein CMM01_04360 [Rhodopirellula sp.]|nr:hypothetical protein [Rhodopirellula sp.]
MTRGRLIWDPFLAGALAGDFFGLHPVDLSLSMMCGMPMGYKHRLPLGAAQRTSSFFSRLGNNASLFGICVAGRAGFQPMQSPNVVFSVR